MGRYGDSDDFWYVLHIKDVQYVKVRQYATATEGSYVYLPHASEHPGIQAWPVSYLWHDLDPGI